MTSISPEKPVAGQVQTLAPGIRCILAPNPSPMTYWGTNTYLVGTGSVAVIDPGPALPAHQNAILAALQPGETISHILVTHAHVDHSPLARPLAQATGAPVLAYGDALAGRSDVMRDLVARGLSTGGEGVDRGFAPDITLADNDVVSGQDWSLTALWTPGHMANHLSFDMQGHVFTGDHVMGWASSLVSPPDGDLTEFMATCDRFLARDDHSYYPGHGAVIPDPAARMRWLIDHRLGREANLLAALADHPATIPALTRRLYADTPPALLPAAERNVFAHMIDLVGRGKATAAPGLEFMARFSLS